MSPNTSLAHIASAFPGAGFVTLALVLVVLATVVRGFYVRVGHEIGRLSREHTKTNP